MKSIRLTIFFVLVIFVVTTEANVEGQINNKMSIRSGGYKTWLNEVTGYNKNDFENGYAGIIGKPITSLRVSGGQKYRVHVFGSKWYGEMTGNNQGEPKNGFAGTVNGDPIDGVAIDGGVEYVVHLLGGIWLDPIIGYNITDDRTGYAGLIGKPIDAIMIKDRTYAVSYTDMSSDTDTSNDTNDTSSDTNDTSSDTNDTSNNTNTSSATQVNNNNNSNNNQNKSSLLKTIFTITATLAVLMIITVLCLYRYNRSKNEKKQNDFLQLPKSTQPSQSSENPITLVYPQSQVYPENQVYPGYLHSPSINNDELPPPYSYPEVIEERTSDDLGNMYLTYSNNGRHSQIKINSFDKIEKLKDLNDPNQNKDFIHREKAIKVNPKDIHEILNDKRFTKYKDFLSFQKN